jgi:hypothetical protein
MDILKDVQATRQKICEVTGLSQEELFEMQVNEAVDFLWDWIGKEDEASIQVMISTPLFWVWWLQDWNNHDKRFLANLNPDLDITFLKPVIIHEYRFTLRTRNIAEPNSVVLESFHKMIKQHSKINS